MFTDIKELCEHLRGICARKQTTISYRFTAKDDRDRINISNMLVKRAQEMRESGTTTIVLRK